MLLNDFQMKTLTYALKAGYDMFHDKLIQRGISTGKFRLQMTVTICDEQDNPVDELRYIEGKII